MEILSITVPVFVMLGIGYISKVKGLVGSETRNFLSKLIFYIAFPALTFRTIVSFNFADTFNLKLVAHNLMVTTIIFIATFFMVFLIKDKRKRGSFNMGCFRTNQGYMGLPIVKGFYGEEAMSKAAVINGFDNILIITLSVFALEVFKQSSLTANQVMKKFLGFLTNPFVLSALSGLILSYYKVPVLKLSILDELLKIAGGMALPLALISIGCSIEIRHLVGNLRFVLAASFIKLIFMPVIAYLLAYYIFRFRGTDLGLSVILLSMPSSVSSYVMASEMEADEEVMAAIIGLTTFLSVFTVSLIQFGLKSIIC